MLIAKDYRTEVWHKTTHSSFLNSFVEQFDNVHPLHSTGLETLCPRYQIPLETNGETFRGKSEEERNRFDVWCY